MKRPCTDDRDCGCWACIQNLHLQVLRAYAYGRRRAAELQLLELENGRDAAA
jgi:hypothetical protein